MQEEIVKNIILGEDDDYIINVGPSIRPRMVCCA
jgi:hypothetical protein